MSQHNRLKFLAASVSAIALVVGAPAWAQDQNQSSDQAQAKAKDQAQEPEGVTSNDPLASQGKSITTDANGNPEAGAIIVTGSRIQRTNTYSSISPLQTLDTQTLQDTGQFDAATILQTSIAAAGQQIDATFQGYVLDNGPGSETLNLRGLGADRTLLLIDGRRMAPAGVEGAPTNPSINLLPSSLIARYDLLLDGASSVYGSDAIAGVGNIILRKDIDSLEVYGSGNYNPHGGGNDWQVVPPGARRAAIGSSVSVRNTHVATRCC